MVHFPMRVVLHPGTLYGTTYTGRAENERGKSGQEAQTISRGTSNRSRKTRYETSKSGQD